MSNGSLSSISQSGMARMTGIVGIGERNSGSDCIFCNTRHAIPYIRVVTAQSTLIAFIRLHE